MVLVLHAKLVAALALCLVAFTVATLDLSSFLSWRERYSREITSTYLMVRLQ